MPEIFFQIGSPFQGFLKNAKLILQRHCAEKQNPSKTVVKLKAAGLEKN
jgi:hypothetical protein